MKKLVIVLFVLLLIASLGYYVISNQKKTGADIKVAISPYQDIGMVVNIDQLGLEDKYQTEVELVTLAWEDIVPSMASAGSTFDLGYASLIGYLTKSNNLNRGVDDELIFIYPAYVFKGGGFISYDESIPVMSREDLLDPVKASSFFSHKIGAEKNSLFDMMLYQAAKLSGTDTTSLDIIDTTLDSSLLAARNGDLPIASAGLTQLTEARRDGGRLVLSMDTVSFADITGFITTRKTYEAKKNEIRNFIKMWFECVDYVLADPINNSAVTREYLNRQAATKYSPEEYAEAISNEFFPRNIDEMNRTLLSEDGAFSMKKIVETASEFLVTNKIVKESPKEPVVISLD